MSDVSLDNAPEQAAPDLRPDPEVSIWRKLVANGMSEAVLTALWPELQEDFDEMRIAASVESCARSLERLKGMPSGAALRWAFMCDQDVSLREAAKKAGVSHVALRKTAEKILKRMGVTKTAGV